MDVEFEANFLRLVDQITNGSKTDISVTGIRKSFYFLLILSGTTVVYRPGVVVGAKSLDFDCGATKSIGTIVFHSQNAYWYRMVY